MSIDPGFRFSQSSLAAFTSCPRSFALRYIQKLAWPAVVTEPVLERERHLEIGSRFHLLIQQYMAGMPAETIARTINDETLQTWWVNFSKFDPLQNQEGRKLSEFTLSTRIRGYFLDAKYDLLIVHPDRTFTIFDWKTNKVIPPISKLGNSLQTMVYRFVIAQAGKTLIGGNEPLPEKIQMVYWYVEYPDQPVELVYTPAALDKDNRKLNQLIQEIDSLPLDAFSMTTNHKTCELCQYRSYCDRGIAAGNWDPETDSEEVEDLLESLNMDEIGEIAF